MVDVRHALAIMSYIRTFYRALETKTMTKSMIKALTSMILRLMNKKQMPPHESLSMKVVTINVYVL